MDWISKSFLKMMLLKRLLFFFVAFNSLFITVLGNIPDSLENRLMQTASDTAKVMVYNSFARDLMSGQNRDLAQALQYAQEGLTLAEQAQFDKGRAELHRTKGSAYYYLNDFEQAIEHYKKALEICEKLQYIYGMALNSYNLGISYRALSKINYSLDFLQKALSLWKLLGNINYKVTTYRSIIQLYQDVGELSLAEAYAMEALQLTIETGDRQQEASLYELLARINVSINNLKVAEEYYQKSLLLYEELEDQLQIARTTNNIAVNLYSNNPEIAIDLLRKSIAIYEKISPDNYYLFEIYNNLAKRFQDKNQNDSVMYYKEKALSKAILSGNLQIIANAYNATGTFYLNRGDIIRAEKDFRNAYDIASKNGLYNALSNALSGLSSVSYEKGDYKTAIGYHQRYEAINDSLSREENKMHVQQLIMKYEFEKEMTERNEIIKAQLDSQQQANRYQKIIVVITSIAMICAAILLIFIIRSNKFNKRANLKLKAQNEEIIQQHDMIARQKKEITDSIIYARRIQRAIFPTRNMFKDDLEMFIFYRPRDIVSGDFYWMSKKENKLIIVSADCTGHGVPGAFMSMLGVAFLNEIIGNEKELYANEILNKLREKVIRSLNQAGRLKENKEYTTDGMDIVLCVIDYPNMTLQYAGAYDPLILIRNNELTEIKADRMPVAYSDEHGAKKFTNHLIPLFPKDCIYMFTDGFTDQFGGFGEKSKKYSRKRLKSTLLNIYAFPMQEQKKFITQIYDEWKGNNEQVDDVLMIGIRI